MKRVFWIACGCAIIVVGVYVYHFTLDLRRPVSTDPSEWGALGDYVGGLLNPILSFASILLILQTIRLQQDANDVVKEELDAAKLEAKLRAFDGRLSSLIAAQSEQLNSFKLRFDCATGSETTLHGVSAIIELELLLASLLERGITPNFKLLLAHLDSDESLLSALRRFYIPLRMITNDLSDAEGFSNELRERHIEMLVGFTDFSLLRVVMLSSKHLDSAPAKYIRAHSELRKVLMSLDFTPWPEAP